MAIVCGAGVGTWLTERLVAQVASLCESPSSVTVYRTPSNGNVKSRGVHASEREILASRPIVVRAGERTALTFAHRVVATPAPRHGKSAVVIGSGEVIALQQATGLSEITSAAVVPNSALTVTVGLALRIAQARTSAAAQRLTWTNARFDPERQSQADGPRQRQPSRVLVQVMGSHEQVASGELTYVSGTTISSHSAIAVRQAIVDQTLIGTHTAYQVLGDRCLDHAPEPAIRLHAGSLRELSVR